MAGYRDRGSAGAVLAGHLTHLADRSPLVLGIPRGGVEVAAVVVERIGGQLGVVHAVKVGAPGRPELAMGAVAADGVALLDEVMIRRIGVSEADVAASIDAAVAELRRREDVFAAAPDLAGRTVVLVDDGVATGSTLLAALDFVRRGAVSTLVAAVPVGPASTIEILARRADEVVCPLIPERFLAVGQWYEDFSQTPDARVIALLKA